MFLHEYEFRVKYNDADQMGIVHHANYLHWFTNARIEYLRTIGYSYARLEEEGVFLPVLEAFTQYKASARFDDLILIRTKITELKKIKISFEYEVLKKEPQTLLAIGHTVLGCINHEGKPVVLPEKITSGIKYVNESRKTMRKK